MKFYGSLEFSVIKRTDDRVVSEMPILPGIRNSHYKPLVRDNEVAVESEPRLKRFVRSPALCQ